MFSSSLTKYLCVKYLVGVRDQRVTAGHLQVTGRMALSPERKPASEQVSKCFLRGLSDESDLRLLGRAARKLVSYRGSHIHEGRRVHTCLRAVLQILACQGV